MSVQEEFEQALNRLKETEKQWKEETEKIREARKQYEKLNKELYSLKEIFTLTKNEKKIFKRAKKKQDRG